MRNCVFFIPLVWMALLFPLGVLADSARIAVLYPQATGGYEKVFGSMIEGVIQVPGTTILTREITDQTDVSDINGWLQQNKVQSIIALGSNSYKIRDQLAAGLPVIIGAMVIAPDGFNGISLAGDPRIFLQKLENLAPSVRRVHTVYSRENSGWLIDIAREQAAKRNIQIIAHEATSLKQGLKLYDQVLSEANGETDAIWLPLDRIVPDKAILPRLLKTAWDKRLVVFSNNPLHVKKGVLFALYPDHAAMGVNLGNMAVERINADSPALLLPAKALKVAVNKRTASHLGLHFSKSQLREFDIVFPSE